MKSFYLYLTAMKSITHFLLATAFGLSSTLFCFASEGNLAPTKISTQSTNYSATLTTEKKTPDSWILIVDAKEEDREGYGSTSMAMVSVRKARNLARESLEALW